MTDDRTRLAQALTCARGCRTRGQHVTDCADDECRGCLPRPAEHGTLCTRCWTALTRDIATAPSLVEWLREHLEPGAPGQDGKTTGSRVPPAPLSTDAVAAADDLHAQLASWVLLILEQHPDNLAGPSWNGTRSTRTGRRRVEAHVDELGYPARLNYGPPAWSAMSYDEPKPAGLIGFSAEPTRALSRWLLARLRDGWTVNQEWAHVMVSEITNVTATYLARWPMEARARNITDLPCPACDRLSLVYYPVTCEQGQVIVQCEHHECGQRVDEDKFDWYARVHIDQHPPTVREHQSIGSGHAGYGGRASGDADPATLDGLIGDDEDAA